MKKLILFYLPTLIVLLGFNLKLFSQENNLFENKTDLEIKQLFAHENYIVTEIYPGIHPDFKNQSIYTSKSLDPTIEYKSIETAIITDSSFSIILLGFEKLNSLKIIYTLKGIFNDNYCSTTAYIPVQYSGSRPSAPIYGTTGHSDSRPFVAFIGSNGIIYFLFNNEDYKRLKIGYASFHQSYKPPSLKSAYKPFSLESTFYIDEIKCSIPRVNQTSKGKWTYVNGKLSGIAEEYFTDGEIVEWEYKSDTLISAKTFHETGGVEAKWTFENEDLKLYYKTGELNAEYKFLNGMPDGLAKEYDINGQLVREYFYENGVLDGKPMNIFLMEE